MFHLMDINTMHICQLLSTIMNYVLSIRLETEIETETETETNNNNKESHARMCFDKYVRCVCVCISVQ